MPRLAAAQPPRPALHQGARDVSARPIRCGHAVPAKVGRIEPVLPAAVKLRAHAALEAGGGMAAVADARSGGRMALPGSVRDPVAPAALTSGLPAPKESHAIDARDVR